MRVTIVMQHVNFFRNLDTVVRELDARGHTIALLHGNRLDDPETKRKLQAKMSTMGRGLEVVQAEIPGVEVGYRPEPNENWSTRLRVGRQVVNRSIYLRKQHPAPDRLAGRFDDSLPERARKWMRHGPVRLALRSKLALSAWRWIESLSPPSRSVLAVLADRNPDIVIVSPTIWPKKPVEADYIRAAKSRGIPTVGYLNSWDNLTSKGTVHVVPDVFIVWNEALAIEAIELHDIPSEVIRITGAPHLDRFFEMRPTVTHNEMARQMNIGANQAYIIYLCTSRTLIESEVHLVVALADALERHQPGKRPAIVVRPHPVNPHPWRDFNDPRIVVYPHIGDQADCPDAWQEYYNQLSHACCFVGLNTTAFLEAAVTDKPCLTLVSDELAGVQGSTGHFRHLLDGGFLEVSQDMDEVAARITRIAAGADELADERRAFVKRFLRPRGIDVSATGIVCAIIEEMATSRDSEHPLKSKVGKRDARRIFLRKSEQRP